MSGLFGGGGGGVSEAQRYGALQIQTSTAGVPVPIIYGKVKTGLNLIWYGNFKVIKNTQTSSGKGGGGGYTSITYTYTTGVIFGVGEGVVADYNKVWLMQGDTTVTKLGLTEFYGTTTQAPWGFLTTNYPAEALPYINTAYLAHSALELGDQPYLPQMWFEVEGLLSTTGVTSGDANPADVILDFLTNDRYGAGFDLAKIDTASLFTDPGCYENYCGVLGVAFSISISNSQAAREVVNEWLKVTNTAPIWSSSKLKFVPFGDKDITANGYTFTAIKTVRYALTDNDFKIDGSTVEPITVTRADTYDCHNHVRIQCIDRNNDYNLAMAEAKDPASIDAIGLRTLDTIQATFLPNPAAAQMCAELIKNRDLFVRNKYMFKLSWEFVLLEPMDIVSLTLPALGLNAKTVRILSVTEGDDGMLDFEAEEFVDGMQWAPVYPVQLGQGFVGSGYAAAGTASNPLIFEPTMELLNGNPPQVWLAANGDPDEFGGANVYVSTDDVSYQLIGTMSGAIRMGYLTSALPAYTGGNPDVTNTLAIDISQGGGDLPNFNATDAGAGQSVCYVGGEFVSYEIATLTGVKTYDLTRLWRGQFSSAASSHGIGVPFVRLDDQVFKYTIPAGYVGKTIYVKLAAFNIQGQEAEDISTLTPTTYTILGTGSQAPVYLNVVASGKPAAGATLASFIQPYAFQVPVNLASTLVNVETNPTATAVFSIKKNGTTFATISIATSGVVTLSGSLTNFTATDTLTVIAPSPQDATLANVSINLWILKTS